MKYLHLTAAAAVLASSTFASTFSVGVHISMEKLYLEKDADTLATNHGTAFTAAAAGTAYAAINNNTGAAATAFQRQEGSAATVGASNLTADNTASQGTAVLTPQKDGILAYGGGYDLVGHKTSASKFLTSFGIDVGMNVSNSAFFRVNLDFVSGKIEERFQDQVVNVALPWSSAVHQLTNSTNTNTIGSTITWGSDSTYQANNTLEMYDFATTYKAQYEVGFSAGMKFKSLTVTAGMDMLRFKVNVVGTVREYANSNAAGTATNDLKIKTDAQNKNVTLLKVGVINQLSDKLSISMTYKFGKLKTQLFEWDGTIAANSQLAATANKFNKGLNTGDRDVFSSAWTISYTVM